MFLFRWARAVYDGQLLALISVLIDIKMFLSFESSDMCMLNSTQKVFEELLLVFVSNVTLFSTSIRHYIYYALVVNQFIHRVLILNCLDVLLVLSGVRLPVVSRSQHSCAGHTGASCHCSLQLIMISI